MTCDAKVVESSVSPDPKAPTLYTVAVRYWRAIHAELMTHRVFSRNASSSRAIPVKKMLQQVWNDPAGPVHWGKNQSGMQANEQLTGWRLWLVKKLWRLCAKNVCLYSWTMMKLGLHKQVANRPLEAWQYINVIITSTEWENFFKLRDHKDAQPEIKELAQAIKKAMEMDNPIKLNYGQWHLPYVRYEERRAYPLTTTVKLSTARNARVSYLNHDQTHPNIQKDSKLHDDLVIAEPIHASPAEHPATPDRWIEGKGWEHPELHGNLVGWKQYRKYLEQKVSL